MIASVHSHPFSLYIILPLQCRLITTSRHLNPTPFLRENQFVSDLQVRPVTMFPNNAAAAKRLGKRKVREVGRETAAPVTPFNLHGHHLASTSDGRRSQVQKVLNNAAAAASPLKPSFSFMALLTADDDEQDDYAYECCPIAKDIKNQGDPINQMNQMIMFHNDNLRQSMLGMFENHYHNLHHAAEEHVAKRLKETTERNTELERRNAELERLAELYKGEAERLLLRVRYLEQTAMTLNEGLQEANAARRYAEPVEEEAESSFEDPDRVGPVRLDCKVCERQLATMMVWPCRHVCVCTACDAATKRCPVCRSVKTTSVELCLPLD